MKLAENNKNNNFLPYLLVLVGFFIVFFVTKNLYADLQSSLDLKQSLEIDLQAKNNELNKLNTLEKELESKQLEDISELTVFSADVSESAILEYLHEYAALKNINNDTIVYRSINISDGGINEIWFGEMKVDISAIVAGEKTLMTFLDYLASKDSKYKIFIRDFSYPMNETTSNMQVSIPLTIYYK